ncbi:tRNA(Ile)-lysidine synthetase [Thermotoga neapolitana DSM 4359]|uniref:tRNA(Ile)-lysidine synthase n=1 Tax=Thermotoga neapolitana (strain ATCC 49049 / DSM 4359 / NBRC 107923 / NS-E) TaxID=309803 RepID=B9KB65_THENN|nr:tRNA lysidine(34) synthetase TilS [Thermotoga sp. RQ7]ACM22261.1 tRNA(Ile)-lysidine synthase [Thermotoga neapolitana DSM 4359]
MKENRLIGEGDIVLVAVSGGIDSMTLLYILKKLSPLLKIEVLGAHLDHRIRESSERDRKFVEDICRQWNVPVETAVVDVPALWKGSGKTLEEVAREVRYSFLEKVAKKLGATKIALAHHKNDLLETVLHRLVRGTGPLGIACIPVKREKYIRPFLVFKRSEIEDYAQKQKIPFVVDETNYDIKYTRNFIRHRVVPLLKKLNPNVEDAVYRLVSISFMLREFVEETVQNFVKEKVHFYKDFAVFEEPKNQFLFLEVTRWVLKTLYGRTPDYEKLIESLKSRRVELWKDVFVERSFGYGAVGKTLFKKKYRLEVKDGIFDIEGFKIKVNLHGIERAFWLRNRRKGDRIIINGSEEKLKDIFIEKKVPVFYRDRVPLLVDEQGRVLWVPGIAFSDEFPPEVNVELLEFPIGYVKGGTSFEQV